MQPTPTSPVSLSRRARKRQHAADSALTDAQAPSTIACAASSAKKCKLAQYLPLHDPPLATPITWKGIVAYDGVQFQGFQAQDGNHKIRTVQECIEDALVRTTGETIRIRGASRTDKGVSALGQVIAFESQCSVEDAFAFRDAMNTRLPNDVVVQSLEQVASGFVPRANASSKCYEYVVVNSLVRPVFGREHSWWIKKPWIDVAKMQEAAAMIFAQPLEKDFGAFTPPKSRELNLKQRGEVGNVCAVSSVEIVEERFQADGSIAQWNSSLEEEKEEQQEQQTDSAMRRLRIRFRGNRFVYKMVRNLVATLVEIGKGTIPPSKMQELLESNDRASSTMNYGAPPNGLTLVRVFLTKD